VTLPSVHGESVVLRILDKEGVTVELGRLGMGDHDLRRFERSVARSHGAVLVTGPTGSGKSTTLYAAVGLINSPEKNIVTIEDPVEYQVDGVTQVQVNPKAGLTFASALRSILRQDPDVVLVGEIRDIETAQVAVQASLTGHLVLSTLHTNDAPNAVTRLMDMGLEGFKIASALRGVVAQRLMRRLCPTCREISTDPVPEKLRRHVPAGAKLSRAVGCPECAMTGYRGRFSIVEVLGMTKELERRIGAGAPPDELAEAARMGGMKNLWDSGIRHVLDGHSSIEELLRVVDVPTTLPPAARPSVAAVVEVPPAPVAVVPMAGPTEVALSFDLVDREGAAAESQRRGAGSKILLVDDEDHLRRLLKDLLEREGYEVVEARDGAEALEQVDRHGPDVMLLDLNLPGMDGYSVLAHVRSRPATEALPIVVLTAKGDEDNEVRVLQAGADDFLTKPFRARALYARLEKIMARRKA
ncbi:MAG TPA: type II/IV secretion system protein, partial [Gemmatimonadales bacterium]|nr:type II/IV secretion system protein [Gemmatimonadales bacterium]